MIESTFETLLFLFFNTLIVSPRVFVFPNLLCIIYPSIPFILFFPTSYQLFFFSFFFSIIHFIIILQRGMRILRIIYIFIFFMYNIYIFIIISF